MTDMTDMTRKWTPEEDAIIRERYEAMGPRYLFELGLMDCTYQAIRDRAAKLGCKSSVPPGRRRVKAQTDRVVIVARSVWDLANR
jgi:hypothetical protein